MLRKNCNKNKRIASNLKQSFFLFCTYPQQIWKPFKSTKIYSHKLYRSNLPYPKKREFTKIFCIEKKHIPKADKISSIP